MVPRLMPPSWIVSIKTAALGDFQVSGSGSKFGTGGMGTTLFYVIGGGLMVAAVVLLVTKKRMEHKN